MNLWYASYSESLPENLRWDEPLWQLYCDRMLFT